MNSKISYKFLGITAVLFITSASIIGFIVSEANKESITQNAQLSVDNYVQNVNANLETINFLLSDHVSSSMGFLKAVGKREGTPNISGTADIKGQSVPDLRLGDKSQVEDYKLVDEILKSTEATATLFVRKGDRFIRVSTNVRKDDGSRAIGTELDPNGKAIRKILNGESFYGAVDILGKPYLTGYEPMFDRNNNIVGIWYVGYPVRAMDIVGKKIESSRILDNGYLALVDYNNRVLFKSKQVSEEDVLKRLSASEDNSDWVISISDFTPWNYKIVCAYPKEDIGAQVRKVVSQTFIFLAVVALALLLMVYFLLRHIILKAVHKLAEASTRIANGDYSVLVDFKSKDELGKLSDTFNMMVSNIRQAIETTKEKEKEAQEALKHSENLNKEILSQQEYVARNTKKVLEEMEKFAKGDLTVHLEAEKDDDIGRLIKGLNASVDNVKQMIADVSEAVAATASAAAEISSGSSQMASGAQEQTKQINEIAAAIEEMSKTIFETARNINLAADVSKQAGQKAKEGGDAMNMTANGMNNIADVVSQAAVNVQELGKSGEQIGEIIQVIDDIADQTNLLALNAAIEAARAGEQGRGFAVVADEVRKLAERTTKATKEIADMITKIQHNTQVTVDSIQKGTQEVNIGRELASKTGSYLTEIIDNSDKTSEIVIQVAAATEEQSAAAEQISKNVEGVSSIAEESSSGAIEIAKAADDLDRLAVRLQDLVSKFKVNSVDRAA